MIEVIHRQVTALNNSTYFLAFMILILNIGSRHLDINIGYTMQKVMSSDLMKLLIIFTMVYTATRDIYVSFVISLVFLFIMEYILNEGSNMCLIPNQYRCYKPAIKKNSKSPYDITEIEVNNAIQVLMKAKLKNCS